MKLLIITLLIVLGASLPGRAKGINFSHLSLVVEGGATRSFIKSNGLTKTFFEPTSSVHRDTRPTGAVFLDFALSNFFEVAAGLGFSHVGQSTEPATVFLKNDIFEHQFRSSYEFNYLTIPLMLKTGIRQRWYSLFLRTGITPSLLTKEKVSWEIDGVKQRVTYEYFPPHNISYWDAALHLGGEAGITIGKYGVAIIGQYNFGLHDIEYRFEGSAVSRSYGISLQLRRFIY